MKTEHAIDWRKNVIEIEADYAKVCQQRDDLLARIDVACEVQIVSSNYDRIRQERVFAADDIEYDLFAAGWKAAIAAVRGAACANPVCDTSGVERECCGTFFRTPHRSTCQNYRGKKGGAS